MRLSELTAIGLVPQRMAASVAGTLGIVGLLLCAIGIYGVTSYSVAQRTREIGIRVALGADRRNVMRLVLRQGLMLAAIGTAIGLVIAGGRIDVPREPAVWHSRSRSASRSGRRVCCSRS